MTQATWANSEGQWQYPGEGKGVVSIHQQLREAVHRQHSCQAVMLCSCRPELPNIIPLWSWECSSRPCPVYHVECPESRTPEKGGEGEECVMGAGRAANLAENTSPEKRQQQGRAGCRFSPPWLPVEPSSTVAGAAEGSAEQSKGHSLSPLVGLTLQGKAGLKTDCIR